MTCTLVGDPTDLANASMIDLNVAKDFYGNTTSNIYGLAYVKSSGGYTTNVIAGGDARHSVLGENSVTFGDYSWCYYRKGFTYHYKIYFD